MLRRLAHPRTTFAAPPVRIGASAVVRQDVARIAAALGRILLLPFIAVGGALAGLVLVLLLPICGIATIAEGLARGALTCLRAGAHPWTSRDHSGN